MTEPWPVRRWTGSPSREAGEDALRADGAHVWAVELTAGDPKSRRASARAALTSILGAYACAEPTELRIAAAPCVHCGKPHGKPFLDDPAATWLRFNLSHTGELALVAVAHGREVGVDVEEIRGGRRIEGIAERRFTPAEASELRRLSGDERVAAFHRLWTRKEAYVKATGAGLVGGLGSFDALALEPPGGAAGWTFADLDAGPGMAAALALAPSLRGQD